MAYIVFVIESPSSFDAKLKSLTILKKILSMEIEFRDLKAGDVMDEIAKRNITDLLLKYFNP
jgi:hypothetical protein